MVISVVIHTGRAIEEEKGCKRNPADGFDLIESDIGRFFWGLKAIYLSVL
jgi:hypothetical protein